MTPRPVHDDIKKYGYLLAYSPSRNKWYAAYDTDCKGAAWFEWTGKRFELISRYELPNDRTYP